MTRLILPPLKDKSTISFKRGERVIKTLPFVDMAGAQDIFYQLGLGSGVYACVYGKQECQLLTMNNEYVVLENGSVPIVGKTYDIGNGYTLRITLGGGRAWVINVNKPLVFWTDYPRVSTRTMQFGNGEFRNGFIALDDQGNYICRNVTKSDGTIIGALVKRTPILTAFHNNIPQTPMVNKPADPARDAFNWGDMICKAPPNMGRHQLDTTLFYAPAPNPALVSGKLPYQYATEFLAANKFTPADYSANIKYQNSFSDQDKANYNYVNVTALTDNRYRVKYVIVTISDKSQYFILTNIFYCQGAVGN